MTWSLKSQYMGRARSKSSCFDKFKQVTPLQVISLLAFALLFSCGRYPFNHWSKSDRDKQVSAPTKINLWNPDDEKYNISILPTMDFRFSLLNSVSKGKITICLSGKKVEEHDEAYLNELKSQISKVIRAWVEPLRNFARAFSDPMIIFNEGCDSGLSSDLRVETYDNSFDACQINHDQHRSCALPSERSVYLDHADSFATVLHEFGHMFGFADTYFEEGRWPDDTKDPYSSCRIGYRDSVMCAAGDELLPADIDGIRRLYCGLFDDEGCLPPGAIENEYFGNMLRCKFESKDEGFGKELNILDFGSHRFNLTLTTTAYETSQASYRKDVYLAALEETTDHSLNFQFLPLSAQNQNIKEVS